MEESVALDSGKQKQFVKSVRGIKKLLKKKSNKKNKEQQPSKKPEPIRELEHVDESEPTSDENDLNETEKNKANKKIKKRSDRGLVYLSHIPHGFYEHQMTEYFKQFGAVTNVRVIKSKRTGNSKGYAFVEFKEPTVAEIVAETMNNYLMGKRLIKAVYIPPEKQRIHAMRKNWNVQNNPASEKRLKMKKALNAHKSDQEECKIAKKLLLNLLKTKEKLNVLGIDYDFFMPVDFPEDLKDNVEKITVEVKEDTNKVSEKKIKVENKVKLEKNTVKNESKENKDGMDVKKGKSKRNRSKQNKAETKSTENLTITDNNIVQKVDPKQQKSKEKNLKDKGIKAPESFIRIDDTDDSGSNDDFDSDEFEKMMENDDDEVSSGEDSEEENDDEKLKNVKTLIKPMKKENLKPTMKNKQNVEICTSVSKKRRNIINAPITPKKAKFEKQNKKTLSKILKKKK